MRICLLDSGIGVIPFIKEIIKNNKNNEYIIYIDKDYFPYGNKTNLQMENHLKLLFEQIEKLKIDLLLICCNTLSYFYLKTKTKASFLVRTILEINIKSNNTLLGTTSLSRNIGCINAKSLAKEIEENNIKKIIKIIKEVGQDNLVMSCTHYSLIKNIFSCYYNNIYSYEYELIKDLPSTNKKIIFYASRSNIKKINNFFPKLVIKEMNY